MLPRIPSSTSLTYRSRDVGKCARRFIILCSLFFIWPEGAAEVPVVTLQRLEPHAYADPNYGNNLTSIIHSISVEQQNGMATYKVARHVTSVTFVCNASYPVRWTYEHFDRITMICTYVRTARETGDDFYDTSQYKFSSTLVVRTTYARTTGRYSCQSTAFPDVRTDIYLYVLGFAPPYLVYAGQTMMVQSQDNISVVIPCLVSSPDTKVELYKRNDNDYILKPLSPSVEWNPQIGFTLTKIYRTLGDYKCLVAGEDEDDDYALFSVIPGVKVKNRTNNILQGNASFSYDPILSEIKCCASGSKAPILRIISCESASMCEIRQSFVLQRGSNGYLIKGSSCTGVRVEYREMGVFRCKGEGIDVVKHFFTQIDLLGWSKKMYFDWNDADPAKLIYLGVGRTFPSETSENIYEKEAFSVTCEASSYYFSEGIRWALKWKNQTVQFLSHNRKLNGSFYDMDMTTSSGLVHKILIRAHLEMDSVTCYVPIWNSTEWSSKTIKLSVQELSRPSIAGPAIEELRLVVNQTNVTVHCPVRNEDQDWPVDWRKNGEHINDPDITIKGFDGPRLIFTRVTHVTQGDYVCNVENPAGIANKTFRIFVGVVAGARKHERNSSTSSWGATSIVITSIIVAALFGGIGFLVWRLKLQKNIIDHFTRVVFRDASAETQSNGGIVTS